MTNLSLRIAARRMRDEAARGPGPQFDDDAFSDDRVGGDVANALYWDLAVPRDRVSAQCDDGWVTLSGDVDRPYQRSSAEADARRVQGVRGVINVITVVAVS